MKNVLYFFRLSYVKFMFKLDCLKCNLTGLSLRQISVHFQLHLVHCKLSKVVLINPKKVNNIFYLYTPVPIFYKKLQCSERRRGKLMPLNLKKRPSRSVVGQKSENSS